MDLKVKIKQKNERLLLQNAILQQRLCARVNTPAFSSYLIAFIAAPFIVGVFAQGALGAKGSMSNRLYRAVLPGWRVWSLLKVGA